jgi:hypothetical protein
MCLSQGATAAELLDGQEGAGTPQIEAVTSDTDVVTLTCGGNDVGYVGRLMLGSMVRPLRSLPAARRKAAEADASTWSGWTASRRLLIGC